MTFIRGFQKYLPLIPLALIPIGASGFFYDVFASPKWQIVYLTALAGFVFLFFHSHVVLPKFSKTTSVLICLLAAVVGGNYIFHTVPFISHVTVERLSFLMIAVGFYNLMKKYPSFQEAIPLTISASFVIYGVGFLVWILLNDGWSYFSWTEQRYFTFGNVNMAAQFMGISLLFSTYTGLVQKNDLIRYGGWGIVGICFIALYLLNCRSITLALTFSLPVLFFFVSQKKRRWIATMTLMLIFMGLLVSHNFSVHFSATSQFQDGQASSNLSLINKAKGKTLSVEQRLGVWQATISMIQDHPLGVGADKFHYAVTPYKEKNSILSKFKLDFGYPGFYEENIEKTAHNDYLNTLAEEGILFFALLLALLIQMIRERRRSIPWRSSAVYIVISYGIFIGVEAFFQFPASTPYPFFVTAIMTGVFLYQLYGKESISVHKGFLMPVLPLFLVAYGGVSYAQYVLSVYPNSTDHLIRACEITPLNGRVCMRAANVCMREKNFKKAEEILLGQCNLFPHNFFAQRGLIRLYYLAGDEQKSCDYARLYNSLFNNNSTLKGLVTYCQDSFKLTDASSIEQ